jgi:threonyl-tRNA synthetase
VQAVVMNITDAQADYAASIAGRLTDAGVRVELDKRNEKIGFKIREARLSLVPYMLIMGEKEKGQGIVTVRDRSGQQNTATVDEFIAMVQNATPQI